MTGNVVIDLAISLAGVALLAGLAALLFKDAKAVLTEVSARDRLAFDEPDFDPAEWIVDEAAGAALARNDAGEIAFIAVHGDGLVTRRLPGDALSVEGGAIRISRQAGLARDFKISAGDEATAGRFARGPASA